jgi:hypothetical protein
MVRAGNSNITSGSKRIYDASGRRFEIISKIKMLSSTAEMTIFISALV